MSVILEQLAQCATPARASTSKIAPTVGVQARAHLNSTERKRLEVFSAKPTPRVSAPRRRTLGRSAEAGSRNKPDDPASTRWEAILALIFQEDYKQPLHVYLAGPQNGYVYLNQGHNKMVLGADGIDIHTTDELERFIPSKGVWKRLGWETRVRVGEGESLLLRLKGVTQMGDWDLGTANLTIMSSGDEIQRKDLLVMLDLADLSYRDAQTYVRLPISGGAQITNPQIGFCPADHVVHVSSSRFSSRPSSQRANPQARRVSTRTAEYHAKPADKAARFRRLIQSAILACTNDYSLRLSLEDQKAILRIFNPYCERPGCVYTHMRLLRNRIVLKFGRTGCLSRRMVQYDQCGGGSFAWLYYYNTSNTKLVERLVHLELSIRGARVARFACKCGHRHQEYFWEELAGGIEGLAAIIEDTVRSVGESFERIPIFVKDVD
ncbi:hypothetical protein B0H11DRAFT_1941385 [Mycena galericulata]|nr:hypothetical protein B0H11DRAFT_1941385 [Mycena galericulata]